MTSIGIDIGSYSIKIAEIQSSGKGYELKRYEVFNLSIDPNKDREIEILDVLRSFSSQYEVGAAKYTLGEKQENVSLRRLIFPFKERHKILKSLPFELEDNIPFSLGDAIFEAKVTRYSANSSEVIAIACPKETVQKKIRLSDDCLFNLDILSVGSIAFANHFENWSEAPPTEEVLEGSDSTPQSVDLVLDIGHKNTNLLVIKKGILLESRTFSWGGFYIANALASKRSVHFTEAVRDFEHKSQLLLENEGATESQVNFSDTVKNEIDLFAKDLNLTLLELKSLYNVTFEKGFVTGGVSQLKNLCPYLTQKAEIPFKKFNIFNWTPINSLHLKESDGASAGLAIALAIEGLKKPKNPAINLRKEEFAIQSQALQVFMNKWSYTISIAAAAFVFFVVYGLLRIDFAQQMVDRSDTVLREQAVNIVPGVDSPRRATNKRISNYIKEQENLKKMQKSTERLEKINSALDILNLVSKKLPDQKLVDLNIKMFSLSNQQLSVQGEVQKKANIKLIENALKALSLDGKISEGNVSIKASQGWTPFSFNVRVRRIEEN